MEEEEEEDDDDDDDDDLHSINKRHIKSYKHHQSKPQFNTCTYVQNNLNWFQCRSCN